MAKGIVRLDMNMLLNMLKNDRSFEIRKGLPRDAVLVSAEYNNITDDLEIVVSSDGIGTEMGVVDIELYGNADAVDASGVPKSLIPAFILGLG